MLKEELQKEKEGLDYKTKLVTRDGTAGFKTERIKDNIMVFSNPAFLKIIKGYASTLEVPDNTIVFIYEGWNANKEIPRGICDPLVGMGNCEAFPEDESRIVYNTAIEAIGKTRLVDHRKTDIIRIFGETLNCEIKFGSILFHELRHHQQFFVAEDAFRLINEQKEKDEREDWDKAFEKDAIIYAREKLKEVGFSSEEISVLFKQEYPKRYKNFIEGARMSLEDVIVEAKRFSVRQDN